MCGIIGVVSANPNHNVAPELFEAAMFLQHRGQDAAGIVTCGQRGRFYQCKGNGMARDVFTQQRMYSLVGNMGICHLRYPTAGSSATSEAQPFYVNSPYGISLSHNGNLVNAAELRKYLDESVHRHINTDSDSELLLNIFAAELEKYDKARVNNNDIFKALEGVYRECRGAYACTAMLAGYGIIGFRDPNGIRPLLIGERYNEEDGTKDYMLASESVVLTAHNYSHFRDLLPGEAVIIPKDTMIPEFKQVVPAQRYTPDIFEYVYFARPDSVLDGISVYRSRIKMGAKLAENIDKQFLKEGKRVEDEIDVVIPVPDTSRHSALECANRLKLPYREGFVKNRYVGRTFIMPDQKERTSSVRRKLNAMQSEFHNKSVLLVDDSIVRGTTSKEIVSMAKEAGARRVYFASCSPVIRYNHIYGIDLADTKALVGYNRSVEDIAQIIHADKVFYQDLEDLMSCCQRDDKEDDDAFMATSRPPADSPIAIPDNNITENGPDPEMPKTPLTHPTIDGFEIGVFTGEYITGLEDHYLEELEKIRALNQRIREQGAFGSTSGIIDVKAESDISIYNSGDYQAV